MDTVLGLAVTAAGVQTVLVEGRNGDGATLGHDEFDLFAAEDGEAGERASEHVAETVLSIASSDGHRLHSIGVTWSDDADLEASLLLDSLADLGLANVVAVQSPDAAEALACSIGHVMGHRRTAVCVIEPDAVIVAVIDTHTGEAWSVLRHDIDSDERLLDFLDTELNVGAAPDGLFLVGSVGELTSLSESLEQSLGIPVFDPPEADLALAHGAALASVTGTSAAVGQPVPARRRPTAAMAMLIGGAAALVVSTSLVVSPQLLPQRGTGTPEPAAVAEKPTQSKSEAPASRPSARPSAPAQSPSVQPAPQHVPPSAPVTSLEAVPPAAPAPITPVEVIPPAPDVLTPVEQAPQQSINPIAPPPVVAPEPAPAVPVQQPRLRDRIFDKIPGLNRLGH